ncbi:glycosyltransferase family 2 protein [Candidatus Microgenomates bacterium]|nr:glycosyltransferase family 2 protein [Candidatus Microgenomates bacterium]
MKLSIVIVSFNTCGLLEKCLNSVYQSIAAGGLSASTEVIVVDNASRDGSLQMVEEKFPKVRLIKNKKNLGFAAGNNQGIKSAKGDYYLLLNSDTELLKDTLKLLLGEMEKNASLGVVGSKLLNKDNTIQPSAGFFPDLTRVFLWMTFLDDLLSRFVAIHPYHVENGNFYDKKQEVDWVTGACFLISRKAVEKAGLLDEGIFMYGEEVEWCYRIKKAGYQVEYFPQASIYHYKGQSAVRAEGAGIDQEYLAVIYFYKKHQPSWKLPIVKLLLALGALLRLFVFGIIGRYRGRVSFYAKALKMVGR